MISSAGAICATAISRLRRLGSINRCWHQVHAAAAAGVVVISNRKEFRLHSWIPPASTRREIDDTKMMMLLILLGYRVFDVKSIFDISVILVWSQIHTETY